jgi:hypothetical protein
LLAGQAKAQPAAGSVVLIDAFKFSAKATQAHARLRAGVEEALARDGWTVLQGSAIADCGATTECLATVARAGGVGYVLRIAGQRSQEYGYEVTLDLYSSVTKHVRGQTSSCGMCDSKAVAEIAGKAAIDLLAKTVQEEAESRQAARPLAPPVAPPPTEPSPPALVTPPAPAAEPSRVAWLPWTMIGVGAVGMAYGGWALAKNGDSSGSPRLGSQTLPGHDTYSSQTIGVGGLAAGGALLVAGVLWIAVTPSRSVTVSASPNRVAFKWRF